MALEKTSKIYPQKGACIIEKLAYSFHLGSDKNKKPISRIKAKSNISKTTSLSNNAIQNLKQLSRAEKHNYRKYDNDDEDVIIIKGTSNLVKDVKDVYIKELEKSKLEYNNKQTRDDRKIVDYFNHISNSSKIDLACEIIIELGNKKYWDTKDINFKKKMTTVYEEQVKDLEMLLPSFKVSSAIIHYDETSPHLHIVGIPIQNGNKNGMSKKVGKSTVFTKESLKVIQDKMRSMCIEAFNNEYHLNLNLKEKKKGRNKDIRVSDMDNYMEFTEKIEKNKKILEEANRKNEKLNIKSEERMETISNLKTTKINRNSYILSLKEKEKLEEYIKEVKTITVGYKEFNEFILSINKIKDDFEKQNEKIKLYKENERSLSIKGLELNKQLKIKEECIDNLEKENYNLKSIVYDLKDRFKKLIKFLNKKLFHRSHRDEKYKEIVKDLSDADIFTKNDLRNIYTKENELER